MTTKRPKYKQLTISDKIHIIKDYETGMTNKVLAKKYGVHHSSISYILKNKECYMSEELLIDAACGKKTRVDFIKKSPLDTVLCKWYNQAKSRGESISGPVLKEKALYFNATLGGPDNFRASEGWLSGFKQRNRIGEKLNQGENSSTIVQPKEEFREKLNNYLQNTGYDLDNVYNATETSLAWKTLPSKILASSDNEYEDRVTILICSNASGTDRIPLLVIGRSQNSSCLKNVSSLPVLYRGTKTAWVNGTLFQEWYESVFMPHVKARKPDREQRFLLMLDDSPYHLSQDELDKINPNFKIFYLSSNINSSMQPMNQGVIEALKGIYKRNFLRDLIFEQCQSMADVTAFIKKWSILDCCLNLSTAWASMNQQIFKDAWNRVLQHNPVASNSNERQVISVFLSKIPNNQLCSAEDIDKWMREDQLSLSNDDIIVDCCSINEEHMDIIDKKVEIQKEEEEEESDLTLNEVIASTKMLLKWYKKRPECTQDDFVFLDKFEDVVVNAILENSKSRPT